MTSVISHTRKKWLMHDTNLNEGAFDLNLEDDRLRRPTDVPASPLLDSSSKSENIFVWPHPLCLQRKFKLVNHKTSWYRPIANLKLSNHCHFTLREKKVLLTIKPPCNYICTHVTKPSTLIGHGYVSQVSELSHYLIFNIFGPKWSPNCSYPKAFGLCYLSESSCPTWRVRVT